MTLSYDIKVSTILVSNCSLPDNILPKCTYVYVPLGEKLATTVGVTKYLKSKLSLAFPL